MSQLNELTNDQLIAILKTQEITFSATVYNAVNNELLERLTNPKRTIDTILDIPAIKKEIDEAHKMIKDLHERCDQTAKELIKLKDLATPTGVLQFEGSEVKFTPMGPARREAIAPQPGDSYTVNVGHDYTVFRNGTVINWSDDDMLNFSSICQTPPNLGRALNAVLKEYKTSNKCE